MNYLERLKLKPGYGRLIAQTDPVKGGPAMESTAVNARTYVQGCGYHEMAYGPPEVVAEFLKARGFQVEVISLDAATSASERLGNALVLVKKSHETPARRSNHSI
jgi:hypothetical protein